MNFSIKNRRRFWSWAFISCLAGDSLAVAREPTLAPAFQRVNGVAGEVAIVPMTDAGANLLRILCGQAEHPAFTPTPDQVRAAEAGLIAFLRVAAPPKAAVLWQKANRYRRQYGGVVIGQGTQARHRLIISASCRTDGDDGWLRKVIAMKDGGTCYYQLIYDLSGGSFSNLQINGEG